MKHSAVTSEQTCAPFTLKDIRRRPGRWSQTSVCRMTSQPPCNPLLLNRCLICLAGEPLILKSVSAGKRLDSERDRYRLTARILGIFSPPVQEEARGSTLVLSAVSCEWNTERIWMLLFSNMRIGLTRRFPGMYQNSC